MTPPHETKSGGGGSYDGPPVPTAFDNEDDKERFYLSEIREDRYFANAAGVLALKLDALEDNPSTAYPRGAELPPEGVYSTTLKRIIGGLGVKPFMEAQRTEERLITTN